MSTATAIPKTVTDEDGRKFAAVPLDPLWKLAFAKSHMPASAAMQNASVAFTTVMFADLVGHSVRAVSRWTLDGAIPWMSADLAAVNLGYHPLNVWGYEWLNVKGDYERIASGEMDKILDRAIARSIKKGQENAEKALAEMLAIDALAD